MKLRGGGRKVEIKSKINKAKNLFFEKIIKIDKFFTRLIKKIQTTTIRNEKGTSTTTDVTILQENVMNNFIPVKLSS